ncbi:MAG TPA: serine hydrolase [Pyrinomonadaceae bacterium]
MRCQAHALTLAVCLLLTTLAQTTVAQEGGTTNAQPAARTSHTLQELVDEAARVALTRFALKGLQEKNLAITLIDLRAAKGAGFSEMMRRPQRKLMASFRGDVPIYPASVVKLFYLVAAYRWIQDGKLKETDELRRALRDMIVDSSNDASHYVLDVVTGTTSGGELPPAEMQEWATKRNAVNRYFASLGYKGINANQKPWCEGPYGRERAFLGEKFENRNKLTTDGTARLLAEIVTGESVTPEASRKMLELLKRDPSARSDDPDDQARGFTGGALPSGARLWSKAGWTSTARHDAAYIELPDGARFVLVIFTTDQSQQREIIPTVARTVMAGLGTVK